MWWGYEENQERRGDENSSYVGKVRQHIYLTYDLGKGENKATGAEAAKDQEFG